MVARCSQRRCAREAVWTEPVESKIWNGVLFFFACAAYNNYRARLCFALAVEVRKILATLVPFLVCVVRSTAQLVWSSLRS